AQDIESEWMELLELCVRDPESAVVYTFEDPSQAIYRDPTIKDACIEICRIYVIAIRNHTATF
ncbi:MAG: hypothetical protein IIB38_01955, partial [Candidatus Hydrogenedentes bacterium]|nr:hypothetical protein [Candidatus Hydrogenedentota bacterium]